MCEATRTVFTIKDICAKGFHVETGDDNGKECQLSTKRDANGKEVIEMYISSVRYKDCPTL